jgi:hypothetical protein
MARPSSYNQKVISKIDEYLGTVGRLQTKLPTRYGFAKFIGVNGDTLVEWEKKDKEFSAAIKKIDNEQKEQLMDDGLYGGKECNVGMAIFLLKANHGMIETERRELVGKDGGELVIKIIQDSEQIKEMANESDKSSDQELS